jgi:hypothetical protein
MEQEIHFCKLTDLRTPKAEVSEGLEVIEETEAKAWQVRTKA